jgi:hypothetical protein
MNTNNIELEDRIRAAQVRSAYSNTAPGMGATAVAGLLVAGILGGVGAADWVTVALFGAFMLVQVHAAAADRDHRRDPDQNGAFAQRFDRRAGREPGLAGSHCCCCRRVMACSCW